MEACEGLSPGPCWRLTTVYMSMSEHGPYQGLVNPQIAMADLTAAMGPGLTVGLLLPPAAPSPRQRGVHTLHPTPCPHPQEGEREFPLWKTGMGLREVRVLGYLLTPKGVCAGWGVAAGVDPAHIHLQAWHSWQLRLSYQLGPDAPKLLGASFGFLKAPSCWSCQGPEVGTLQAKQ